MPILLDQNWYALNENRSYPLDDAATGRDDLGDPVPTDVVVDCAIRFPDAAGVTAYLAAVAVSSGLVTVVFQGSPNVLTPSADGPAPAAETGIPLAAASIPQPVTPYTAYALAPMATGVSGWVAFGRGVANPYSGRLSAPQQGAILPRCAAAYPAPPITGIGQLYIPPLQDLVTLAPGTDVVAGIESIAIGDAAAVDMIVFRLDSPFSAGGGIYQQYAGPCGGRPESNSCGLPDILQLAGVSPDPATGNINISFPGATTYPMAGGIAISVPASLASLCPDRGLPDPTTGDIDQGASFCGDTVVFGAAPPAGFAVISGVFSSSVSGYQAAGGGTSLSVATLDPPPATIGLNMTLLPGDSGLNGGIAFGYADGSYAVALVDGYTGDLSIASVVPMTAPAIVAATPTGAIATARRPSPFDGASVVLTVTLAPSANPGQTHVTARLVALAGYAAVAADLVVPPGAFGVVSYGGMTTFLELQVS